MQAATNAASFALAILGITLTACAPATATTPCRPATPQTPTPTPTPVSAAGREGIDAFNEAMTSAMRRMDDAATLSLWEDDGVSLLPGAPPVLGKNAIAAMVRDVEAKNPGMRMKSFEMQCGGIEIEGNLAHEYCDEHQVVELGGGKPPFDGHGRMLFVLHRSPDGSWRLRREVFQMMKGQ